MDLAEQHKIIAILETINGDSPAHFVPRPHRRSDGWGVQVKWSDVFAGNCEFAVPGWTIVVFNDCDSWDYIEAVITSWGERYEVEPETPLFNWMPGTMHQKRGWSDAFTRRTR